MPDSRLATMQSRLGAGDARGARVIADAMLADSGLALADRIGALVLRSRAHEALSDLPNAIVDLDGALALDATQARLWNELGILCADAGMQERATAAFDHATRADPGYARAWNNLGNALRAAGRGAEAVRAAERAVAADPNYALAWSNLGALKRDAGDDSGAEAALRRALELQPNLRGALVTLAGLLRERSDLAAAAEHFARAVELDPRDANAALLLAGTLAERDDLAGARAAYARAEASDPRMLRALLGRCLTLPMLTADAASLVQAREEFADGLATVEREAPVRASTMSAERTLDELRWSNFLLAYQGGDDKPLQAHYAGIVHGLVQARAPEWLRPLSRRVRAGSPIKVGFLSTFFRDSTAGRYFESWIADLPRSDFEVFVYHLLPGADALAQRLAARADHFRHAPWWRPSQVAPRVRADALDVLVYPELGMGAVPFALAALRLAPLQCAGWGHPVTTGHPTIDVFFSSAAMEPPDGASHYTERLVTLPGIGTRYRAPDVPADATREHFGLPAHAPLLLCPQSLFKIHPDNDALFARVMREIPSAWLVCFEGRDPQLSAKFRQRLSVAGVPADRACMLPQCGHDDYLRINSLCDVMIDTLHWSGGNTSLDALACGLPIVTLPGRFMRGRQSAGMLRLMGIDELVARDADDYVRIVARLCSDEPWRAELSARIRDGHSRIFDDPAPSAAFAEFLRA
ncbi:MAG: tetratricopeptide repeat protein [Casimicrobiaceae bacterium]